MGCTRSLTVQPVCSSIYPGPTHPEALWRMRLLSRLSGRDLARCGVPRWAESDGVERFFKRGIEDTAQVEPSHAQKAWTINAW